MQKKSNCAGWITKKKCRAKIISHYAGRILGCFVQVLIWVSNHVRGNRPFQMELGGTDCDYVGELRIILTSKNIQEFRVSDFSFR